MVARVANVKRAVAARVGAYPRGCVQRCVRGSPAIAAFPGRAGPRDSVNDAVPHHAYDIVALVREQGGPRAAVAAAYGSDGDCGWPVQ